MNTWHYIKMQTGASKWWNHWALSSGDSQWCHNHLKPSVVFQGWVTCKTWLLYYIKLNTKIRNNRLVSQIWTITHNSGSFVWHHSIHWGQWCSLSSCLYSHPFALIPSWLASSPLGVGMFGRKSVRFLAPLQTLSSSSPLSAPASSVPCTVPLFHAYRVSGASALCSSQTRA